MEEFPFTFVEFLPKHRQFSLGDRGRGRGGRGGPRGRGRGRGGGHSGGPGGGPPSLQMVKPGNWVLLPHFEEKARQIWSFEPRPQDVWIVTPPKCGTTWMQELAWLLLNNLDFETARSLNQFYRSPFIEMGPPASFFEDEQGEPLPDLRQVIKSHDNVHMFMDRSLEYARDILEDPRLIKTHLPIAMLSPRVRSESKIIYVGRNLKDACVSLWHHMDQPGGDFKTFAKAFKAGEHMPGDWPGHIKDAWTRKDSRNVFFVWYEDMKADLGKVIDNLQEFLGTPTLDKDQKTALMDYLSIDNFRKNTAVNKEHEIPGKEKGSFIRKGIVGDHKNYFDQEMLEEWDKWLKNEFIVTDIDMSK